MFYLSCPETGSESWTFRSSLQSYCYVTGPLPRVRDGQVAHLTDWVWEQRGFTLVGLTSSRVAELTCPAVCTLLSVSSALIACLPQSPTSLHPVLPHLPLFFLSSKTWRGYRCSSGGVTCLRAHFCLFSHRLSETERQRDRELLSRLSSRGRESLTLYCPSIACSLKFEFVKINKIPMLPDHTVALLYTKVTCESQIRKIYNITTIIPRFILSVCARVYVCVLIEIQALVQVYAI